jgi:hypothetical protein
MQPVNFEDATPRSFIRGFFFARLKSETPPDAAPRGEQNQRGRAD